MGEIINLQLGQCGNTIGDQFWSLLRDEHCLDNKGQLKANSPAAVTQNIRSYYYEFQENYFAPRALLVDLEPSPIEVIQAKGQVSYNPNNYVFGQSGAGYNWAKGHYTEGAELVDQVLDVVRAEVERADCIQGFQILHSISGGTGSGMGTLIISKLREEYPDRMLWAFSHAGTTRVQDSVVTVYNNVLALHQLIENTDAVVYLDDEVAYPLSYKHKILNPTKNHLNSLWASILSDITSGMRFPTQSRLDLRKLACNLVPFPRTHFLVPARSPISTKTFENNKDITNSRDITTGLFDVQNLLLEESQVRSGSGRKHLSASCIFRGDIPIGEIDEVIAQMQNKNSSLFCEWIPDNLKTSLCSISPINLNMSGAALINTTAIIDTFNATLQRFHAMFRRKAFLHWYLGEGMDEMEFTEAQSNLEDLTHEYQMYQDASIDRNFMYNSDDEVE